MMPPTVPTEQPPATPHLRSYAQRTLVRAAIYTAIGLVVLLIWYAVDILLLVFAGILLAVFLRGLGRWLSEHTPLSTGWAVGVVSVLLVVLACGGTWKLTPLLIDQARELAQDLPQAFNQVIERVQQFTFGRQIITEAPASQLFLDNQSTIVKQVTSIFGSLLGLATNLTIILFVGIYLAAKPGMYLRGIERLMPIASRRRTREVLTTVGYTLQYWLVGQFFSIMVVGLSMVLGYTLIGIPLALVLGVLAGLLEFIPNFGPMLSVIPALLIALLTSPTRALYVLILYAVVQTVESYLLTPLVQQRAVELPPVVTIIAVVLMGKLFGVLGLLLATPLAAVVLVLVKLLYVEDALGDRTIDIKGEEEAQEAVAQAAGAGPDPT
jgi:predicted PurR-regulated permease PerM